MVVTQSKRGWLLTIGLDLMPCQSSFCFRNLKVPRAYDERMDRHPSGHDADHPETHDQLVTIRQFGDMAEALLAKGCLESAGIECFLTDANIARMEWPISRGMRLQVNADDAKAAAALLEQLAPQG